MTSSHLLSVGYDPDSGVLECEFTNGTVFQYLDVPDHVYAALMSAPSMGTFHRAQIYRSYEFRQVS